MCPNLYHIFLRVMTNAKTLSNLTLAASLLSRFVPIFGTWPIGDEKEGRLTMTSVLGTTAITPGDRVRNLSPSRRVGLRQKKLDLHTPEN